MDLVLYAVPAFLLLLVAELAWGVLRGRNTYRLDDTINSLALGTLSRLRGFLWLGVGGAAWAWAEAATGVPRWPLDAWWTWVVAFVAYDLCYYWVHRCGHEVNLLWASHVAHHQSEEYNLSTALRQTSTGVLTFVFYLPMFFLGVPAEVVVTVGALNLIYQFWVHTQHVGRLGWLEWVFVTPSNHRVHHAQNDRYLDRNYGGVFIVWDRLFGTFQDELDDEPPVYGIRHALHSWNPVWANLHVYADCLRDSWRTRHWRDKAGVWLRGPAFRPADLPPHPPFDPARFVKYTPAVGAAVRAYALVQFLLVTAAALALLVGWQALAAPGPLLAALWLIGAFVVQGAWLDGRRWALAAEVLRVLAGVALVLALDLPAAWQPWLVAVLLAGLPFAVLAARRSGAGGGEPARKLDEATASPAIVVKPAAQG